VLSVKITRRKRRMIKIDILGKEYDFPSSWDDITMKQYCKLFHNLPKSNDKSSEEMNAVNTIRCEAIIISRLLGVDDDFVEKLPIQVFAYLQHEASFIYSINNFLESKTFILNIGGKKYYMPEPNEMSLRQYIDADMIMKEETENQFIELLACLLLPCDNKNYDGKYQDLIPKIEKMKASDGLPFIYTFFKKKELSKNLSEASSKVEEVADQLLQRIQDS
jgi:hypothetical protein